MKFGHDGWSAVVGTWRENSWIWQRDFQNLPSSSSNTHRQTVLGISHLLRMKGLGTGDWGLGTEYWGLGTGD
ncbi:hypothetical protein [Scytonema sp. NUACC26]|uniref:hypothetical protein n=1 Tax=Scytonema sp. NUACC26 TaxID=3140176 RepID=UPI0038B413FC